MNPPPVAVFWFRRDLRLQDNTALHYALKSGYPVLPIFIFDEQIINELPADDPRISFIHEQLSSINQTLKAYGISIYCKKGNPLEIWKELLNTFDVKAVYANRDYEPYALKRDAAVEQLLNTHQISWNSYKDHVIFEGHEILKADQKPYTVYTPYKNKWRTFFSGIKLKIQPSNEQWGAYFKSEMSLPSLEDLGFVPSTIVVQPYQLNSLGNYEETRDVPSLDGTSYLSPHLRFGTVGLREVILKTQQHETFLNELIWREFFIQIMHHFPTVVHQNFKSKYDNIQWRNNETEFKRWCAGETGYPIVDAGMRQLNATGYMHNRVRMITAGFLCKHLLIDWRWGEAYFAEKLLDFELASNNGNWQWSAGTGCDAAPYFRIFNPSEQVRKFDKKMQYIKKWLPDWNQPSYPAPIVEHKYARQRALDIYKQGLNR